MRFYELDFKLATQANASNVSNALTNANLNAVSNPTNNILGNNKLNLKLDENNPYAVRITFTIQQFSDAGLYTPSILSIYNPATSFFTNAKGLIGATITLKAGIKENSLYSNKLQLTPSKNNIIFNGVVARAVPSYQGKEPFVSLLLSPIEMGTKMAEVRKYSIQKGEKIATIFKEALMNMMASAKPTIIIDESAESLTLQNKQTYTLTADYFNTVISEASNLGMRIAVEKNTFIIYDATTTLKTNNQTFKPQEADFLSQPEWQTTSTIQCSFGLRGDLNIGQKMQLPAKLALSTQSLTSNVGSLAGVSNNAAIIATGEFTITSIFHQGDSRNISAESWATTIIATNTTNLSSKGIL